MRSAHARHALLRSGHKVENPKQAGRICPHSNKIESDFGSKRGKLVRRIFIRILSDDVFSATEMEFVFVEVYKLIGFADEMHFNPAQPGVVDWPVPPLTQIEVCPQFAFYPLQQIQIELRSHAGAIV